ncbi:hypothetical protein HYC85_020734 [Camellia sinensis]|uniref:Uncharacterized protein n=1 Tax=Camellia sinensis TaxID=4442 RepID=A0A7J7GQN4_CAMSI|nr:hypothetical protein HYC85_020734 [Camellia sinensis]
MRCHHGPMSPNFEIIGCQLRINSPPCEGLTTEASEELNYTPRRPSRPYRPLKVRTGI